MLIVTCVSSRLSICYVCHTDSTVFGVLRGKCVVACNSMIIFFLSSNINCKLFGVQIDGRECPFVEEGICILYENINRLAKYSSYFAAIQEFFNSGEDPFPLAFDSHFHLDRLEARVGKKGLECIKAISGREPRVPVRLCGGVINYCDPKRHRDIWFPDDRRWKVAVGVHPNYALIFDEPALDVLGKLICDIKISALEEVGLDYSIAPGIWSAQLNLFPVQNHLLLCPEHIKEPRKALEIFNQFLGDKEGMFHQVKEPTKDCDVLQSLWWKDGDLSKDQTDYSHWTQMFLYFYKHSPKSWLKE